MADLMMRMAGRGEDGLAKALSVDGTGKLITNSPSKKLIHREFNVEIDGTGGWKGHTVYEPFSANQLEVVIVANQVNREIAISPIFGTYPSNLKSQISAIGEYVYLAVGETLRRESSIIIPAIGDYIHSLQLRVDDGQPASIDIFIYEIHPQANAINGAYVTHNLVAKSNYESIKFNVNKIVFITNDGTEDIIIALNRFDAGQKITLKAGESLNNLPFSCQKFFYQSTSGNQPIRILGVR